MSLKKVNSSFLLNPVPFNGQDYEKKEPGTWDVKTFSIFSYLKPHNNIKWKPLMRGFQNGLI